MKKVIVLNSGAVWANFLYQATIYFEPLTMVQNIRE